MTDKISIYKNDFKKATNFFSLHSKVVNPIRHLYSVVYALNSPLCSQEVLWDSIIFPGEKRQNVCFIFCTVWIVPPLTEKSLEMVFAHYSWVHSESIIKFAHFLFKQRYRNFEFCLLYGGNSKLQYLRLNKTVCKFYFRFWM